MSDTSYNQIPEESIEETRRKKMEEFRRFADMNAIRGEESSRHDLDNFSTPEKHPRDDSSQRRRKKNMEINSYSDDDTKKRIERDSQKELKKQKKEEKKIEKSKARRNRRIFKLVWLSMIVIVAVILSQYLLVGVNDLLGVSRENNPTTVKISIPENPTIDVIAVTLYKSGVIKQPGFF